MRYVGQGYERKVDLPDGEIDAAYPDKIVQTFTENYLRNYGFTDPDASIEAIDWYVVATIPSALDTRQRGQISGGSGASAVVGRREAYFPELGGFAECDIIDRYQLSAGDRFKGPAIVEERESTTVVLPGDVVKVSAAGHLVITVESED